MNLLLFPFLCLGIYPNDPPPCVTFTDGETICFDDTKNIDIHAIDSISYTRKTLEATAIEDCSKGSQFFINDSIVRHLSKKMRRKVFDPYCCKPKKDFPLYQEYTAFQVVQHPHSFIADVLEGKFERDCCSGNCKDLTITAIVFTFYVKDKRYRTLLLEKAKYNTLKKH